MNVATLMHRIDAIYLNDKGESLAEGGLHQGYTCVTVLTGQKKTHNRINKHLNSTTQVITER